MSATKATKTATAKAAAERIQYDPEKLRKLASEKGVSEEKLSKTLGYSHSYLYQTRKNEMELGRPACLKKTDIMAICYILGITEKDLTPDEKKEKAKSTESEDMTKIAKVIDNLSACLSNLEKKVELQTSYMLKLEQKLDLVIDSCKTLQSDIDAVGGDVKITRSNTNTIKQQEEKVKETLNTFYAEDHASLDVISKQVNNLKFDMDKSLYDISIRLPEADPVETRQYDAAELFLSEMIKNGKDEQNAIYNEAAKKGIDKRYIDKAKNSLGLTVVTQGYGRNQKKTWVYKEMAS